MDLHPEWKKGLSIINRNDEIPLVVKNFVIEKILDDLNKGADDAACLEYWKFEEEKPPTKKQLQCTRHDDKIVVSPTLPFLLLLYMCWACIIISGKKYPARSWAIASTTPASGSAQQHISCTYEFVHLGTERSFDTNT